MRQTRVLIVDDHESVRAALSDKLTKNREFQVAATAAETDGDLAKAMKFEPDVVLLDVKRRHGSGSEICRRIVRERPSARVLILTSYPDEVERAEVRAAGAVGYLLKDLDMRELLGWISPKEPLIGKGARRPV